jgi:predicted amidohydrolase YtcJ
MLKGLPIVLSRIDVHALWVSQAVLDAMGALPETVDGGHIVRDADGKPTGIFVSCLASGLT